MKPNLTIRIDQEHLDKLKDLSEKEGRSMSNLVQNIIKKYLDNGKVVRS